MKQLNWIVLVSFFTGILSCGKNDFPLYTALGSLRVLTLKALSDQSEVNPGTTVTIRPVVSDLNGGGRNLNVTVVTCVDPGITLGAQAACPHPDSMTTSSFAGTTLGLNNTYTGEAPTFTVNVPSIPLISAVQKYNGVSYLVIYTISSADGSSSVTAFKRITVSDPSKTPKNSNPDITSISDNGMVLGTTNVYSGAVQNLTPSFSVNPEAYQIMGADGSFAPHSETYSSTWFYTDGTMEFQRTTNTDENQWTPARAAGRGAAIVFVSHDGRGGEDYQIFQFN